MKITLAQSNYILLTIVRQHSGHVSVCKQVKSGISADARRCGKKRG